MEETAIPLELLLLHGMAHSTDIKMFINQIMRTQNKRNILLASAKAFIKWFINNPKKISKHWPLKRLR